MDVAHVDEGGRRRRPDAVTATRIITRTVDEHFPFRTFQKGNTKKRRSYTWPIVEAQPKKALEILRPVASQPEAVGLLPSSAMTEPVASDPSPRLAQIADLNDQISTRIFDVASTSASFPATAAVGGSDGQGQPPQQGEDEEQGGHLRRQVTFIVAAVQTDFPNIETTVLASVASCQQAAAAAERTTTAALAATHGQGNQSSPNSPRRRFRSRYWPRWCCIDCTTAFYIAIASLMISVGVTIIVITSVEHWYGNDEKGNNIAAAQLWVIGPIFLCSGALVCIKLVTRIYRLVRGREPDGRGGFLESDSRQSLAALPPSYSRALHARIPSTVVIEDEIKPPDATENREGTAENGDNDSLRLVTVTCDPPPPTYTEAIDLLEKELAQRRGQKQTRDIGVQSTWSASSDSVARGRLASVSSRESDVFEPRPSIPGSLSEAPRHSGPRFSFSSSNGAHSGNL